MKTTIKPIYPQDAETAYGGFLTKEFATQQLGEPGYWLSVGDNARELKNPVQKSQFESLLGTSQRDSALSRLCGLFWPSQPVAWRLTFEVGRGPTTLWALSDQPTRERIAHAQRTAVSAGLSLWWFTRILPKDAPLDNGPSHVCAAFQSGTGFGQIPYLHTTVFLFNTAFLSNGRVARLPAQDMLESEGVLDFAYRGFLADDLREVIGAINQSKATDVPRCLFPDMFDRRTARSPEGTPYAPYGGPFTSEDLFAGWRRQAEERGFGPAQAEALIRTAKSEAERGLEGEPTHGENAGRMSFEDWLQKPQGASSTEEQEPHISLSRSR